MAVERIVIGTDGSPGAAKAMAWCASLAAGLGATVVAVRAYSPLDELATAPGTDLHELSVRATARLHDEWCAPLAAAGVTFESRLVEDLPVAALVAVATEVGADLIVIGSHGESGWRERLLGRNALDLPHHAPCPIAIVPHDPPARAETADLPGPTPANRT
jgi:nucleotide-binding universal stress UspA family protein